jgi:hypothetical protein
MCQPDGCYDYPYSLCTTRSHLFVLNAIRSTVPRYIDKLYYAISPASLCDQCEAFITLRTIAIQPVLRRDDLNLKVAYLLYFSISKRKNRTQSSGFVATTLLLWRIYPAFG